MSSVASEAARSELEEGLRQRFRTDVRPPSWYLPRQPEHEPSPTEDGAGPSNPNVNPEFPLGYISVEDALRTRHVFRYKHLGCVAFNGMQNISTTPDFADVTHIWPRHLRRPYFYSNKHPFAAFVIQNPTYRDEFLKVLNVSYHKIPFVVEQNEKSGSKYHMMPDLMSKWARLEQAINTIVEVFLVNHQYHSNLDFCRSRPPSHYGYKDSYSTLDELRRRVMDSKHAFGLHFAFVSFMVAGAPRILVDTPEDGTKSRVRMSSVRQYEEPGKSLECWPRWCRDAVDKFGVHPVVMHSFLFSEINDFTKQRVGCFIETLHCEILYAVHRMLERRIPFVIMWPLDDPDYGKETLWELGANVKTESQLAKKERSTMLAEWEAEQRQQQPSEDWIQADEWAAPQPWGVDVEEPGGASWGEEAMAKQAKRDDEMRQAILAKAVDWKKWFAKRDAEYAAKEFSLQERHTHKQRFDTAMEDGGTVAKKSTVILWTKVSEDPPLWVREVLLNQKRSKSFIEHAASQRRYDPVQNQWHLCKEFCEVRALPDSDLNNVDIHSAHDDFPLDDCPSNDFPFDLPNVQKVQKIDKVTRFSDWTGFVTSFHPPLTEPIVLDHPPLLERMYYSYGFTYPPRRAYEDHKNWTGDLDENQLFKLKLNFSDPESPENDVMFKRHAFNFCQFMSTTNHFPPSPLWDLSISNDDFIGKQSSVVIASRFECKVNDRPKVLYRLQVARSADGWDLFVPDASVAVECLRRTFNSTDDVAAMLLRKGMQFYSGKKLEPGVIQVPTVTVQVHDLGWKPTGYKPDLGDLVVWESKCRLFMKGPRAAAAFKQGMLYWRLARHFCDDFDDIKSNMIGKFFFYTWRDDALTDNELDLFIGKYRVYTGYGSQYSETSWWPNPTHLKGSYLDVGQWTPACEFWFQNQLKQMRIGKFKPLTSTQWAKYSRRCTDVRDFANGNREAAASYLNGMQYK